MFLQAKDYQQGLLVRSVTGDPVGGGGTAQYEMTLHPEGTVLWGVDNGGPVWYRYAPEEVIQLSRAQAEQLFAIDRRWYEQEAGDYQVHQQTVNPPVLPETDWYCQECGYGWNGVSGKACPRCGETTMIVSPRGRDAV